MGSDVPPRPLTEETVKPRATAFSAGRPSRTREYLDVVLVAVVFALFVRTFLLQAFVVPTPSMEKTVLVGDHLVVNKFLYAPHLSSPFARLLPYRPVRRGDVVVFKFPEDPQRDFIKRAIGLPGDTVAIRDKHVFVNGVRREDPSAFHEETRVWPDDPQLPESVRRRDQLAPVRVPEGAYFALGDNRDSSYDSRFWGPVPEGNLKGRALFVYWSSAPTSEGARVPVGWISKLLRDTRWSRTLRPVR